MERQCFWITPKAKLSKSSSHLIPRRDKLASLLPDLFQARVSCMASLEQPMVKPVSGQWIMPKRTTNKDTTSRDTQQVSLM